MVALLMIISFFLLFLAGCPIILAIGLPSTIYVLLNGFPVELIFSRYLYALDSFTILAIPVFIFSGNLMNTSGITRRLFHFADTAVGRFPGGLAQVNILASLVFSGMSGAALADVGGLGQMEITAMTEKGFPKPFSAAVTIATSTVGPIFPPSIPLVLFGAITGTSIVRLLLAGIIPAIIAVVFMMVFTGLIAVKRKYPRRDRFPSIQEFFSGLVPAFPALIAPILLIGGMLSGFFTPTEAASVVLAYILFIGKFIYRDMTFSHIKEAANTTILQTSAICIIMAFAMLFGWIMTIERMPMLFKSAMAPFIDNPLVLLLIINLILIVVGMFLDSNTATLIVIPIFMPTILNAGIDPIQFGIIVVLNLMIGLMTPPMGLSLLMVSEMVKVPIGRIFKEALWYFIPLFVTLAIVTFIPIVSLWIPGFLN
ncbi:ABC transporter permease [Marispirochaeta aestuarii]|uniref:ABC transporter permease n=1 Tax=Marispirochaeta aestuarii TaxID=1963862 RepID=A0A1Y1RT35_9SPIO|nr:TRAP transporter large permease [Marispirochaeta aestuarii]ORC30266.1 ABC transporter permease [Marispirochaeta aestuarii]